MEPEPVAIIALPSTNVVQQLDPELVQSLVSTVTAEVTQQLAATLPALAAPSIADVASTPLLLSVAKECQPAMPHLMGPDIFWDFGARVVWVPR